MYPEYIYKSFDIFTKIIIATIENDIKPVGKNWCMKVKVINRQISKWRNKGFLTNLNPFLWRVAEDGKKKTNKIIKKKVSLIDTKT